MHLWVQHDYMESFQPGSRAEISARPKGKILFQPGLSKIN
jgi:hypothetical protein